MIFFFHSAAGPSIRYPSLCYLLREQVSRLLARSTLPVFSASLATRRGGIRLGQVQPASSVLAHLFRGRVAVLSLPFSRRVLRTRSSQCVSWSAFYFGRERIFVAGFVCKYLMFVGDLWECSSFYRWFCGV